MRFRVVSFILLVSAGMALAGCSSDDSEKSTAKKAVVKTEAVDPHLPPPKSNGDFKDGYLAGCSAGTANADRPGSEAKAKVKTDDHRYATSLDYKAGWDKAYFACYDYETNSSFFDSFNPF